MIHSITGRRCLFRTDTGDMPLQLMDICLGVCAPSRKNVTVHHLFQCSFSCKKPKFTYRSSRTKHGGGNFRDGGETHGSPCYCGGDIATLRETGTLLQSYYIHLFL